MMKYEEDKYLDNEEDNELWDDELEISDSYTTTNAEDKHNRGDYEDEQDPEPPYADEEGGQETDEKEPDDYYSEPEPPTPAKPKREGFFKKKVEDEDSEDNDYFDSDDEPAPVKQPKAPKLNPEDPDYWIAEEESPIESIIRKPRKVWKWWFAGTLVLLFLLLFSWIWFFRPYTDNAVKYGYFINMERRGSLIKTFEGTMIPYKELGDPEPLHFEKVRFSVESDSLAAVMKRMMLGCVPARVEYKLYRAPLPWKGEEKMIIIKADTADPRKILPPEYRYNDH